jgi:hypothetical protein
MHVAQRYREVHPDKCQYTGKPIQKVLGFKMSDDSSGESIPEELVGRSKARVTPSMLSSEVGNPGQVAEKLGKMAAALESLTIEVKRQQQPTDAIRGVADRLPVPDGTVTERGVG